MNEFMKAFMAGGFLIAVTFALFVIFMGVIP